MNESSKELNFLIVLLFGILILTFFIFEPFIYTIILAVVFATIFNPVHERIYRLTKEASVLAALLSSTVVLIVVIVPLTFIGVQIFNESSELYSSLIRDGGATNIGMEIATTIQKISNIPYIPLEISTDIGKYVTLGLNWIIQHIGSIFASVAKILMSVFIFLIALYYLFKDGRQLKKAVMVLSPLSDSYDEIIFSKLAMAINSVIRGSLMIALIQGTLTAIGLAVFGVPNPVLWGTVASVAALLPGIGTILVILPAALYLYFNVGTIYAIGLLIWGATAVGLIDNLLGPKLVGRGIKLHSFLILLSILGGLSFFGLVGFILGPLVLSMLFVLLEIYSDIQKKNVKL